MVLPPDCILAEDLTITCVTGRPPINPDTILPAPCATSSLLVGVTLFRGSNLSVASTHNNVSRLATRAIVKAVTQIAGFVIPEKFGVLNCPKNISKLSGIGTLTRCLFDIPKTVLSWVKMKYKIPTPTATSGPCMRVKIFPLLERTVLQSSRITRAIIAIIVGPTLIALIAFKIPEKVVSPST